MAVVGLGGGSVVGQEAGADGAAGVAVVPGMRYEKPFFASPDYDPAVPTPESIVGSAMGPRAVTCVEIERCLKVWAAATTNRTELIEYARTHEGRPLHYLVVTSERNRTRLAEIRSGLGRLADPRGLGAEEGGRLVETLPAVAWLGYCIHGDETEGSDAALVLIHHLLADRRPETRQMLEDLVVIVDPVQNPDGRERFIKMLAEHRAMGSNVDNQSLLHTGYWPRGRVNHYLFDLNRDWIFATQPETLGRLREVARWNPLLFVDAHGMGGEENYLFSPPREPLNRHIPSNRGAWDRVFARDMARAFDAEGWVYYTGEWNEGWYPGYSDSWSVFRGAVGVLHEVSSIGEDGVRRPDGRLQSRRESVHQHVVASYANLRTLQTNARVRLREFAAERREHVAESGEFAGRSWAVLPGLNRTRRARLLGALRAQSVEVRELERPLELRTATDQFGRVLTNATLPAGTWMIGQRQPAAPLVAALLDFDPRMSAKALAEEREEILRAGHSRIYDITAWNLSMMYGLETWLVPVDPPADTRLAALAPVEGGMGASASEPVAWVIEGADDGSVAAAARLMERGVVVRVAQRALELDGRAYGRGSVVVLRVDNRAAGAAVATGVAEVARGLELGVTAVRSGLGPDDLPDLGGEYLARLEPPRIAVVARGNVSANDFGATWHAIDRQLGVRHSHLIEAEGPADLGRYNVLVLPDRGGAVPVGWREPLKRWVTAGGTLIAVAGAAADLASRTNELTQVRRLEDVLGKLGDYERSVFREWQAVRGMTPAVEAVWSRGVSVETKPPWPMGAEYPKEEELKQRDGWNRLFMPQGAILAARVAPKHWLTFGCGERLPVLVTGEPVLMAGDGVEVPLRFGVFVPGPTPVATTAPVEAARSGAAATAGTSSGGDARPREEAKAKTEVARAGWSAVPEGLALELRVSGLLWPEAAQRLANAAAVTRESMGSGQVILFAQPPTFRGAAAGTTRLLLNALVYGPGLGASQSVRP